MNSQTEIKFKDTLSELGTLCVFSEVSDTFSEEYLQDMCFASISTYKEQICLQKQGKIILQLLKSILCLREVNFIV